MNPRAYFVVWSVLLFIFMMVIVVPLHSQINKQLVEALQSGTIPSFTIQGNQHHSQTIFKETTDEKLDPALRVLLQHPHSLGKINSSGGRDYASLPFAISRDESGMVWVDLLVEVADGFDIGRLSHINARNTVQVGSIVSMSVPKDRIETLAMDNGIRFIELAGRRKQLNKAGRIDIAADKVHNGLDLPKQYRGDGVIVGVIDSGIDFSHPDFNADNGSRIQYLVEYTNDGVFEWTKQQIDTDPSSVTQRDLDDGGGHGTHVAGTAAGGGKQNVEYTGIAPQSDIIFVKGMIEGGFSDNTVVGGCQYIFSKADELGKPAVINLSLGSNFGPIDGSSLYEQALSSLTGPGKIIVAAAGNEGFQLIHAGTTVPASTQNITFLLPDNSSQSFVNMWYKQGVISEVAVGAFILDQNQELVYLGNSDFVQAGTFMDYTPLVYDEFLLGYVQIDARTIADPRNGDGNIFIELVGDPDNNVLLDEVIWVVIYNSNTAGRFDMWSFGGEFWPAVVGINGVNEVPGDTHSTIGTPASAHNVIAVGSYVTTNSWMNFDNQLLQWQNPDPTRQTNNPVVPSIGQKSYFSSFGPTRDGRTAPDISAPGELIFSALSSHLTEGQGYIRQLVLQGGNYIGQQGTSMASPHVAGVIALMLQANPTLTYEQVLSVFQQTARTDSWTGSVPNNLFGAGKIDAHAAVMSVAGTGPGPGEPSVLRYFDPESEQRVITIDATLPIDSGFVFGTNRYFDKAKATAFTLPPGQNEGYISQINVWFGYKRDGLTNETYRILVYNGTAEGGPTGDPITSNEYLLNSVNADATFGTQREPTIHTFSEPITVGSSFFVAVDFGSYGESGIGNAGIVSSNPVGQRVSEAWEQWSDNTWHNISDAWTSQQGTPGSGTNGWHMWMEVNIGGTTSAQDVTASIPSSIHLEQNYPNPFNAVTVIQYSLPEAANVSLIVYDVLGRVIKNLVDDEMEAGVHKVQFEANELSSGLYFYRLTAGQQSIVRKMMLLR